MNVFRTKSVEQSIADTDEPDHQLRKNLRALDLVVFGVGVIIGAGIFVLTGTVAASNAGPAIALSFVIAGVACALAALCYAEFASTVPVAGSAYTFSYATFGELVAWIIGWDLALEFTIGSSALAVGFSGYLPKLLAGHGVRGAGLPGLGRGRHHQPARRGDLAAGDDGADLGHQALQPDQPGRGGDQAARRRGRDHRRHRLRRHRELHAVHPRVAAAPGGDQAASASCR